MSTLSKRAMPSLFNIAFTAIIRTVFPVSKQNVAFLKQASYSNSLGTLKKTVSQMRNGNSLVVPSDRKVVQNLVSFGAANLNRLQRYNARNGLEICAIISLARIGTMVITFILKRLQKPYARSGKTTEMIEMVSVTIRDPLLKYLGSLLVKPTIFSPLFRQMQFETKKAARDSKGFLKSIETSDFPKASDNNKKSGNLDNRVEKSLMKTSKICFQCKEIIEKKKFFDERRFGVLEKCDCMLCYGCIRKAAGTSDGVVKGPVWCPSCNVKSDTVASNRSWIEGEKKIEFLETFSKNLQCVGIKGNLKWSSIPIEKNAILIREPKMAKYLEVFSKNLQRSAKSSKEPRQARTSLLLGKDDIWARGPAMVQVN